MVFTILIPANARWKKKKSLYAIGISFLFRLIRQIVASLVIVLQIMITINSSNIKTFGS